MFKKFLLAGLAITISIGLAGCGKTEKQKAEDNAATANTKIAEMNKIAVVLADDFIYVYATDENSQRMRVGAIFDDMKVSELKATISTLRQFVKASNEAIAYGSAKNVSLKGKDVIERACKFATKLAADASEVLAKREG
jgi:hypothetical protein